MTAKRSKRSPPKLDIRAVAEHARGVDRHRHSPDNQWRTHSRAHDLAKRVWKAIEEPGLLSQYARRGWSPAAAGCSALVISEITNPFFPELIQGFEEIAVENGGTKS